MFMIVMVTDTAHNMETHEPLETADAYSSQYGDIDHRLGTLETFIAQLTSWRRSEQEKSTQQILVTSSNFVVYHACTARDVQLTSCRRSTHILETQFTACICS